MKRPSLPALALLATALLGGTALAQTTPKPAPATTPAPAPAPALAPAAPAPLPKPAAANVAEAKKLTTMIGVNHQPDQLIALMRAQMIQLVMRAGNKQAPEATQIVDQILMPDFRAQRPQLEAKIVDAWARNFTLHDLKGLVTFYSTPLGQKLIKTLPAITQQAMQAGQGWGQVVYRAAIQKHKEELIARGLKF